MRGRNGVIMPEFTGLKTFFEETIKQLVPAVKIIQGNKDKKNQFEAYRAFLRGARKSESRVKLATCLIKAGADKKIVKDAFNAVQSGINSTAN